MFLGRRVEEKIVWLQSNVCVCIGERFKNRKIMHVGPIEKLVRSISYQAFLTIRELVQDCRNVLFYTFNYANLDLTTELIDLPSI